MTWLRRTLVVLAALVLFVFAVVAVNQEEISLKFLAWRTPAFSVFWWLLIALLAGLLLGLTAAVGMTARRSMRNRRLLRELDAATGELQRLREQSESAPAPRMANDETAPPGR